MISIIFGILVVIGVVSILVSLDAPPVIFILAIGALYVISKNL